MSHVNYIEHVKIKLLIIFVKHVVRGFASHISETFNKKGRQLSLREDKRMVELEFLSNLPFWACVRKIHLLVHGHSSYEIGI